MVCVDVVNIFDFSDRVNSSKDCHGFDCPLICSKVLFRTQEKLQTPPNCRMKAEEMSMDGKDLPGGEMLPYYQYDLEMTLSTWLSLFVK